MSSKQRIFDTIEQLNYEHNMNLSIPKDIPEGCNVIKYTLIHNSGKYIEEYNLENNQGFFVLYGNGKFEYCAESLEKDAQVFSEIEGATYVYLRLATKDNSDVFTPDCLVGVETDKGYIDDVRRVYLIPFHTKPIIFVHTNDSLYFTDAIKLKYYISDESDEAVSFTEYVNMFYDGWDNKYYECNENEIKP